MIPSREPVAYPVREALTFAEMKIIRLNAVLEDGKMRASATLQNFNDVTGKFDPERHAFTVRIEDLAAASQVTRRIDNILKELDVVVELVYGVQFIQHEIHKATTAGEDTTQLRIDLQVAVDALNADPNIRR